MSDLGALNPEAIALVKRVYAGDVFNPGKDKRAAQMIGKARVLDINVCTEEGCECGWNIQIGSSNYVLLNALMAFLKGKPGKRKIKP